MAVRCVPDLALSEWRALLAARWTLVDQYERDGTHYVVARRDATPHGLAALTVRERQAIDLARQGLTNKEIAFEMGVAASTVGVLLYRAAKRLGCERTALLVTYTRLLPGESP